MSFFSNANKPPDFKDNLVTQTYNNARDCDRINFEESMYNCKQKKDFIIKLRSLLILRSLNFKECYSGCNVDGAGIFGDIVFKLISYDGSCKVLLIHVHIPQEDSISFNAIDSSDQLSLSFCFKHITLVSENYKSCRTLPSLGAFEDFEFIFYTSATISKTHILNSTNSCSYDLITGKSENSSTIHSICDEAYAESMKILKELEIYKGFLEDMLTQNPNEIIKKLKSFTQKVYNEEITQQLEELAKRTSTETVNALLSQVKHIQNVTSLGSTLLKFKLYTQQANVEIMSEFLKSEIHKNKPISDFGVQLMFSYLIGEVEKLTKYDDLINNSELCKKILYNFKICNKIPLPCLEKISKAGIRYCPSSTKTIKNDVLMFKVASIIASCNDISLSCLKVFQVLEQLYPVLYLCISFETLVEWTEEVLLMWCTDTFSVLIIECQTVEEEFKDIVNEIIQLLRLNLKKHLIVISVGNNKFVSCLKNNLFPDDYYELKDNFRFSDLDNNSQLRTLGCEIKFQGQVCSIGSLLGSPQSGVLTHDPNESLSASIVSNLVQKEGSLAIGPSLQECTSSYISRTLELKIELDNNIIKTSVETEVFIISGTTLTKLKKIIVHEDIQLYLPENQNISSKSRLFCSEKNNFNDFSNFCLHFPKENVHHLVFKNNSLWWRESKGQTKFLKDYIALTENSRHIWEIIERSKISIYKPRTLLDSIEYHTVILGESGIGKTTLLLALQQNTKSFAPFYWIMHFNLDNDIKLILNTKKEDYDTDILMEIMYSLLICEHNPTEIETVLLRYELEKRGNIIIIFEGLETVSTIYINKVLDFIHALNAMKVKKVWFASTPQLKSNLELTFRIVVSEVDSLSSNDQISLLLSLWKDKGTYDKEIQIKNFIGCLQHVFSFSKTSILSFPLICVMAAEIFRAQLIDYISSVPIHWPESMDIIQLYDSFIHHRRSILKNNSSNNATEVYEEQEEFFMNKHMVCAVCSILHVSELNQLNLLNKFENIASLVEEIKRYGIVQTIVNKKPIFFHKSLADYFAAMWFSKNLEKSRRLLKHKIFCIDFKPVLHFFDYFLIKGHELHYAVLKNDTQNIKSLLEYGVDCNLTDKAGRTALHLAIIYSQPRISKLLLKDSLYHTYDQNIKLLVDSCSNTKIIDNVLQWRPIQYAIELKRWDAIDLLLKDKIDMNDMYYFKEKVKDKLFVQEGLLSGSEKGYFNLFECFSCCGVNISENVIETNEGLYSPMHLAAKYGHVKLIRFLLSRRAKISIEGSKGITPLHFAASEGMVEVIIYLLQRGADLHCIDRYGNTPLNFAILRKDVQAVILLVEQYPSNIDHQNKIGDTPLHLAVKAGNVTIIEYLLMKGAVVENSNQDGNTALHLAVWTGILMTVQVLIEYGANVNACNKNGDTPLTLNAGGGNLEIVKLLVENGASITKKSVDGNTALHWASRQNCLIVAEYLVTKGADINAQNKYGNTPLHRAVEHGCLATTKFLINMGCNIKLKNNAGLTATKMRSRSKEVTDCIACL